MEALVSGIAARAIFIEGEEVFFVEADQPEERRAAVAKEIPNLMAGAIDVIRIPNTNEQGAFKVLLDLWNKDRSLRMLEVLLDSNEYEKNRMEAANALQQLLEETETRDHLLNLTFAIPFWDGVDVEGAKDASQHYQGTLGLIILLERSQENIATVRQHWESLDPTLFENPVHRGRFELRAKDIGAFRAFALAMENREEINNALFECYIRMATEKNSRAIINEWSRFLTDLRESKKFADITILATDLSEKGTDDSQTFPDVSAHEVFTNVQKQKDGVIAQLSRQNPQLARKFARELVDYQLQHGGPEFAAKSLCSLSQDAKSFGQYSLQLEWVKTALEVAPKDAWAHGQAGDVYLSHYRFTEALQHYEKAGQLGDEHYALIGKGRVERESANYAIAIKTFDEVIERFPDNPETDRAWAGKGEALRDMWLFDDALEVYKAAKIRYPNEKVLWCGYAAVLRELGQIDSAQKEYFDIKKRFPDDPYSHSGWADTFKVLGDFESALATYDEAIQRFPGEPVPLTGKADTLSEWGHFKEAMDVCQIAVNRFPYHPSAFAIYGKVLKDSGHLDDALLYLGEAITRFEFDPYLRAGFANCLKEQGKIEEALREYDKIVHDFPHNLVGWSTRANLLKELGEFDEALVAYSRVLERRPSFVSAMVSKAAILVIQEKYEDALALLPSGEPRMKSDWIAHHIRGMILLKTNRVEEAITHFTRGLLTVPFFEEKRYYENALALAKVMKADFEVATKYAANGVGTIAKILEFHCFGEIGQKEKAKAVFRDLEDVNAPIVAAVRDELAARMGIINIPRAHNDAWIISTETNLILAQAA